jgi:hypothetical protein
MTRVGKGITLDELKKLGTVHVRYLCVNRHVDAARAEIDPVTGSMLTEATHVCTTCGLFASEVQVWTKDGESCVSAFYIERSITPAGGISQ